MLALNFGIYFLDFFLRMTEFWNWNLVMNSVCQSKVFGGCKNCGNASPRCLWCLSHGLLVSTEHRVPARPEGVSVYGVSRVAHSVQMLIPALRQFWWYRFGSNTSVKFTTSWILTTSGTEFWDWILGQHSETDFWDWILGLNSGINFSDWILTLNSKADI